MTTAWFHRQQVRASVCDLGSRDPLLIYAGAGVSIDRTGLDWSDFVVHLLTQRGYSAEMARGLVSDLAPTGAASGAYELFADEYGSDTKARITNELRLLLRQREFMGGQASRAIATLCIRAARQGKDVAVATTNYDEYLIADAQSEAEGLASAGHPVAGLRIENLLAPGEGPTVLAEPANGSDAMVTVTYLHGYVPDLAGVEAFPVVSEEDYLEARTATSEWLRQRLSTDHLLIVGSSLTDPPLLSALLETKAEAGERGLQRVALLPLPSLEHGGNAGYSGPDLHRYLSAVRARMRQFGVEVLFPDHFCQIGQFLTEVAIASSGSPGAYRNGEHRYGRRLVSWWTEWAEGLTREGFDERQSADHGETLEALEEIRTVLRTTEEEMLKLEVWLRWDPETHRELRLWSSSTGTFSSENILRRAPIDRRSEMVAVQTFRSGQPRHFPKDGKSMPLTNRWRSYLAVPLQLTVQREITAGTVLLASTVDGDRGSLHRNKLDRHRVAIGLMTQLGLELARDP